MLRGDDAEYGVVYSGYCRKRSDGESPVYTTSRENIVTHVHPGDPGDQIITKATKDVTRPLHVMTH